MKYYNPFTKEATSTPNIKNVLNPRHETILQKGWYVFIEQEPSYDSGKEYLQRGEITIQNGQAVQLYVIKDLPIEIPQEITAAQGLAYLSVLGLYNVVEEIINNSEDDILRIFWNRSFTWTITSPTIISLADQLSIDLQDFFMEAKKITI